MCTCQRCYKETSVQIMSMFNTDMICMDCKKEEKELSDYRHAEEMERRAIFRGNYNFEGVGFVRNNR